VGVAVQSESDRVRANLDALATLLRLAEQLRRTNAAKWTVTEAEWRSAVRGVAASPEPHPGDAAPVSRAVRAARRAGSRLGNSGEARFGSAGVGRHPDSSRAGERFYGDLEATRRRLAELRELLPAGPGAAADGGCDPASS
jgi:hypothetical protein